MSTRYVRNGQISENLTKAAHELATELLNTPQRVAFAGKAGAGKTTLCELISGTSLLVPMRDTNTMIPIFNHADGIKAEVLEWIAQARTRALIPTEQATEEDFWERGMGLSPALVRTAMWDFLSPLWFAMQETLESAYQHLPPLAAWAEYPRGEAIEAKVAFVDCYKPFFRSALQQYGEKVKELGGDPLFWVDQTIRRSLQHAPCVNGDSRFTEEIDALRGAGWTTIYLQISPETQKSRRPELTEEQLAHISENGMVPEDCDVILDANGPLEDVVSAVTCYLRAPALANAS